MYLFWFCAAFFIQANVVNKVKIVFNHSWYNCRRHFEQYELDETWSVTCIPSRGKALKSRFRLIDWNKIYKPEEQYACNMHICSTCNSTSLQDLAVQNLLRTRINLSLNDLLHRFRVASRYFKPDSTKFNDCIAIYKCVSTAWYFLYSVIRDILITENCLFIAYIHPLIYCSCSTVVFWGPRSFSQFIKIIVTWRKSSF